MGLPRSSVNRVLARIDEGLTAERRPGSGRHRKKWQPKRRGYFARQPLTRWACPRENWATNLGLIIATLVEFLLNMVSSTTKGNIALPGPLSKSKCKDPDADELSKSFASHLLMLSLSLMTSRIFVWNMMTTTATRASTQVTRKTPHFSFLVCLLARALDLTLSLMNC